MEALVDPKAVDLGWNGLRLFSSATELEDLHMLDAPRGQRVRERIEVELWIGPRSRNTSDIGDQFDPAGSQQFDELDDAPR